MIDIVADIHIPHSTHLRRRGASRPRRGHTIRRMSDDLQSITHIPKSTLYVFTRTCSTFVIRKTDPGCTAQSKTCTWLRLIRQTSTRARDGDDDGWCGTRVAHARDASFSSVSRVGVAQRMPPRVVTVVDEEDGGDGGVSAAR